MNNKTLETQSIESEKTPRQLVLQIPLNKLTIIIPILIVILIFTTASALGLGGGDRVFAQAGQFSSVGEPSVPQGADSFSSTGTISFQGELTQASDGSTIADGEYKMRFSIFTVIGAPILWPTSADYEEHPSVIVTDGLFNVLLGSQITIPADVFSDGGDRYLHIEVCLTSGVSCTDFEILGSLPISSVAYAKGIIPGTVVNATSGFGLRVNKSGGNGSALEGHATSTAGITWGVAGSTASSSDLAAGVVGTSAHFSGKTYGVYGSSQSSLGSGVHGIAPITGVSGEASNTSGTAYGVYGLSNSPQGTGVYGISPNKGVYGESDSITGLAYGVYGLSVSPDGAGVFGESPYLGLYGAAYTSTGHTYGIYGESNSDWGTGVYGTGQMTGTVGIATNPYGVGIGVYGMGYKGVVGRGRTTGVVGKSNSESGGGIGVFGEATNQGSPISFGVQGENWSSNTDSAGLYGVANSSGIGVRAFSQNGVGVRATTANGDIYRGYNSSPYDLEFKVTNDGEVYADGSFHSGGADFAELLPAVDGLEPGDVLIIGLDGQLARSTEANQPTVVGVYSTEPGFLGGSADDTDAEGKVPLAVVGVVPVKVSAENGPIRPGDLLTTSAAPGYAMLALPVDFNGIQFHLPGTIIGKALEGLEEGTGIIMVLVTLQ